MSRYIRHPEARMELVRARAKERNDAVRQRCITPGFGWLVLMRRANGYGSIPYDADTYAEAVAIRDRELETDLYESALVMQKMWNPEMSLSRDAREKKRWFPDEQRAAGEAGNSEALAGEVGKDLFDKHCRPTSTEPDL